MMQWEYKAIGIGFGNSTVLEAELNDIGKDGWELVSLENKSKPMEGGLFFAKCIFKRPVGRVGFVTVEGESGEIYHHRHDDPTLTSAVDELSQRISAAIRSHDQRGGRL